MINLITKLFYALFGRTNKMEKAEVESELNDIDFITFANSEIDRARSKGHYNTAKNYKTAINSLSKFLGRDKCLIDEITMHTIDEYQKWLTSRGVRLNTVSCYMRSLRALYNKGVESNDIADKMPFKRAYTGREKTSKRCLLESDIQKLKILDLKKGTNIAMARDLFLFGFYSMGMPFIDIAFMEKSQIKDGYISYSRHKTGQEVIVGLEPCMIDIINRYITEDSKYVFPILSEGDSQTTFKQYQNKLRLYNHELGLLSDMIEASRPLSSYVVRHTWASIAYKYDIELSLISKALGHTKTSTTLLYIKTLYDHKLVDANRNIINIVNEDE